MQVLMTEERKLFAYLWQRWTVNYEAVLDEAKAVFAQRGSMYDEEAPIYHRVTPMVCADRCLSKARRLIAILRNADRKGDDKLSRHDLEVLLEESEDIVNYAAYAAATFRMLLEDTDEASSNTGPTVG